MLRRFGFKYLSFIFFPRFHQQCCTPRDQWDTRYHHEWHIFVCKLFSRSDRNCFYSFRSWRKTSEIRVNFCNSNWEGEWKPTTQRGAPRLGWKRQQDIQFATRGPLYDAKPSWWSHRWWERQQTMSGDRSPPLWQYDIVFLSPPSLSSPICMWVYVWIAETRGFRFYTLYAKNWLNGYACLLFLRVSRVPLRLVLTATLYAIVPQYICTQL